MTWIVRQFKGADMDDETLLVDPVHSPFPILLVTLAVVAGLLAIALYSEYKRGRLRFSLRSLLIATTLIAVVLGIVVWVVDR